MANQYCSRRSAFTSHSPSSGVGPPGGPGECAADLQTALRGHRRPPVHRRESLHFQRAPGSAPGDPQRRRRPVTSAAGRNRQWDRSRRGGEPSLAPRSRRSPVAGLSLWQPPTSVRSSGWPPPPRESSTRRCNLMRPTLQPTYRLLKGNAGTLVRSRHRPPPGTSGRRDRRGRRLRSPTPSGRWMHCWRKSKRDSGSRCFARPSSEPC